MFTVGPEKVILILLIALLVLGPDELPGIARKIGNVMRQLRRMSEAVESEIRRSLDEVSASKHPLENRAADDESRSSAA